MSSISNFTNMEEQPKVGEIIQVLSNGGYVPPNYLSLQGNIVSQSTYPELFSKIGLLKDGIGDFTYIGFSFYTIHSIVYGDSGFALANFDASSEPDIWRSSNGTNWSFVSVSFPAFSGPVNASAFGNGLYVFGTSTGKLATSTDLLSATLQTSGTTSAINALTYGGGLYVYAGGGGVLATSTNGVTWTARTSGTTSAINALAYGNGVYVYGGAGGVLATSNNAITWTARTSGTTSEIKKIIYANGNFLATLGQGVPGAFTSTNAITWTRTANKTIGGFPFYANGVYCVDSGSFVYTSTDLITWKAAGSGSRSGINATEYGNGIILTAGTSGNYSRGFEFTYNTATEFALPTATRDSELRYNFYVEAL